MNTHAQEPQGEAIVFLIDNSATSLNGDFYPNRLEAQKMAVERLVSHFAKQSKKTQMALGTLAAPHTGIFASLTTATTTLSRSLNKVERGEIAKLGRAIRCAFLSLHHRDPEIKTRRVIAMIGSQNGDLNKEEDCESLAAEANKEGVAIDIVAFGDDVDTDPLQFIVSKCLVNSHYIYCQTGGVILSDAILGSEIGPGAREARMLQVNFEDDPDLALTLQMSMQDQPDDPELAEAMRASMEDDIELQNAIRASLEGNQDDEENGEIDSKKDEKK